MVRAMSRSDRQAFTRRFEGREVLDELLDLAGSPLSTEQALQAMRAGQREGKSHAEVIPSFFEGEPHFESPELARRLYQNLLGLWDLAESGRPFSLEGKLRPPRPKKEKPTPPAPFGKSGPDEAFVEAAWRYLEDVGERERTRLRHAFENRQDALLGSLDDEGLSDEGYAVARQLLFELFSMIELGWPAGVRSAISPGLSHQAGQESPAALRAYAEEALFEAEQDEQSPLSSEEAARVRGVVDKWLGALWNARDGASDGP